MPNIPDAPSTEWLKSSFSLGSGECVELAVLPDGFIGMRDSKNPDGSVLRFTRGEFDAFIRGARSGEFEIFR